MHCSAYLTGPFLISALKIKFGRLCLCTTFFYCLRFSKNIIESLPLNVSNTKRYYIDQNYLPHLSLHVVSSHDNVITLHSSKSYVQRRIILAMCQLINSDIAVLRKLEKRNWFVLLLSHNIDASPFQF